MTGENDIFSEKEDFGTNVKGYLIYLNVVTWLFSSSQNILNPLNNDERPYKHFGVATVEGIVTKLYMKTSIYGNMV